MGLLKDLQGLNAAYAEVVSKEAYTVTAADKKGNTPAYQGYKAGKKNVKTGKPLYKAADHLKKEDRESKLWDEVAKMLSELHELRGVQYKVVPLNELKKTTLGSYVKKAAQDLSDRRFDQGDSEKRKYEPDEKDDKEEKKLVQREKGIKRAADKLTKEHHQKDADGKVIEHDYGTPSSLDEDEKYGYDKDGNSLNPKDKKKAKKKGDKPERWQDDDGDGKWYEPGVDVKKESVGSAIDKTLSAAGEVADTAIKLPAKAVGYAKGLKKGLKKASKEGEDKAASSSSPKNEEFIKIAKSLLESGKFSEEEVKGMLWDEGYQRNPEKGEKEDRKYEKVRGERTPMPPRGNKRREEFERWYAANVR